jgi:hypothetical protein
MSTTSTMSLSSYFDEGSFDPYEVDKMLAGELTQLSFTDRERVMDEIHGIASGPPYLSEEGELLLLTLQQDLDTYYYDINANGNRSNGIYHKRSTLYPAYQEARSNNSALLVDREFCRAFLVAGDYDPKKAAIRYLSYLELICKVYNSNKVLYRPILLDDIHEDAKEQLAQGSWQMLPDRDTSGRRIFVYLRDLDSTLPQSLWVSVKFFIILFVNFIFINILFLFLMCLILPYSSSSSFFSQHTFYCFWINSLYFTLDPSLFIFDATV